MSYAIPVSLLSYVSAVPPVVRSSDGDQMITTSLGTTATLTFIISDAVPPVQSSQIQWIYSSAFSPTPSDGSNVDITGLTSLNSSSQFTFSNNLLTLTINNIVPADEGRYFLTTTTVAGVAYSYIDVIVQGTITVIVVSLLKLCLS